MKTVKIKTNFSSINLHIYEAETPKAIIFIIHGMKEHYLRYEQFIDYLVSNNYSVAIANLRGHGDDAKELGFIEGNKPWQTILDDQEAIYNYLKNEYNLNIHLFAHSMGSIIARNIIIDNKCHFQKIILCGAPAYTSKVIFGLIMVNLLGKIKGEHYVSKFLENNTSASYVKAIKNSNSTYDWLSYNQQNILNYKNDPLCNIPFSISAYKALFHLLYDMQHKKKKKINSCKKILFIAGQDDPCIGNIKGLKASIKNLNKRLNIDIDYITYKNMRHEILNEDNFLSVYKDVIKFLEK